ncbi:hypothetical protein AGLY_001926 [Aphis glycines]|uniref:Uncharacterized protein n=1 Tax=Aphis glycines TaxID=307491 RepID=A0A6G0U4A3_APHGL|nr:hypothetical protein AGLY_001926 [Aphis glycines]
MHTLIIMYHSFLHPSKTIYCPELIIKPFRDENKVRTWSVDNTILLLVNKTYVCMVVSICFQVAKLVENFVLNFQLSATYTKFYMNYTYRIICKYALTLKLYIFIINLVFLCYVMKFQIIISCVHEYDKTNHTNDQKLEMWIKRNLLTQNNNKQVKTRPKFDSFLPYAMHDVPNAVFKTREPILNLYVGYKIIATYKGWKKQALKLSVAQNLKESIDIIFNENGQVA